MTNAIIFYTENVCSTPFTLTLGNSPDIFVPVRESFDQYVLSKIYPENTDFPALINRLFSEVYSRQMPTYISDNQHKANELRDDAKNWDDNKAKNANHIVWKWRPIQGWKDRDEDFCKLVFKWGVRPVVIKRKSLIAQALKIFITTQHYNNRWPQFHAGSLGQEDYRRYLEKQNSVQIFVEDEDLPEIRKIARGILAWSKGNLAFIRRHFSFEGSRLFVANSEDIFTPTINWPAYTAFWEDVLQDELAFDKETSISTRKAGLDLKHCANVEEIMSDPDLAKVEDKYLSLDWSI